MKDDNETMITGTQDTKPKRTEEEIFESMLAIANEQVVLGLDMKELQDEAKSAGYDASQMKKFAVAKAEGKVGELVEKAEDIIEAAKKYI